MMSNMPNRTTVVGVFSDRNDAERALDNLAAAGFRDDQVGILTRGDASRVGETKAPDRGSKVGEGAAAGVVVGGILGAAASLLIPGIGPVLAGGILAGVLGTAVVGAAAGGVIGALVGMGIPEEEARFYEGEFKAGRTLVTVKADSRYDEARSILREAGAYDVYDRNQTTGTGMTSTTTTGTRVTGSTTTPTGVGTTRVPDPAPGDVVRDPLPGTTTPRRDLS
jgi:hypothetical protein